MRYMMLMIPKVYNTANADPRPNAQDMKRMMKYNDELTRAGALLALDGLQPPAGAVRVKYPGGKPKVSDGPFAEVKEVLGGYWIIQVKSKEEAIEWARRIPANEGDIVELRQVAEMSDFPPDVQKAANSLGVKAHLEKSPKRLEPARARGKK